QQKEGTGAADPVVLVREVEARLGDARLDEVAAALPGALDQLVQRAELDRVRGASLRAGGLHPVLEPVVAKRALVHAPVAAELALGDHAEAVACDGRLEEVRALPGRRSGPGWRRRRGSALLALLARVRRLLHDEGDVAPGVRVQFAGVVVGVPGPGESVLGNEVPLLAGDLAGFAADADRRVGEEAEPRLRLCLVGLDAVARLHASSPTVRG